MAAFIDTVRDRWEGISPRERKLVLLLGISFVVIVVLYLAMSIRDGLVALEERNARMRRALVVLTDLKARGDVQTPDDPGAAIGPEPVKLESYLTRAAEKVGITIPQYNPRPTVTKNGFVTHAGQVELRDLTVAQVKSLLEAIETDSKVVVTTAVTLTRNFRDKEKLDLKLEVATYSTAGGAAGAGAAKPAAPAMPSAAPAAEAGAAAPGAER
jgi:type II secretory pathway component PulM